MNIRRFLLVFVFTFAFTGLAVTASFAQSNPQQKKVTKKEHMMHKKDSKMSGAKHTKMMSSKTSHKKWTKKGTKMSKTAMKKHTTWKKGKKMSKKSSMMSKNKKKQMKTNKSGM